MKRVLPGQLFEREARETQRPRHQLVVERPLLGEPREHGFADVEERQAAKFGIEIVRRFGQIVGANVFARIDDLLRNLITS